MRSACFLVLLAALPGFAQWQIQTAPTSADLRGIDALGNGIAWASGSEGAVLRTTDDGAHWQRCATPPDAEHLDFRGIQAFDDKTAIIMSSGKGPLSRLYKTTDACQSWTLLFTNPDPDGFWDAMLMNRFEGDGYLLGDPVDGSFSYWESRDYGETWKQFWESNHTQTRWTGLEARPQEAPFAASNSALLVDERFAIGFITGGPTGSRLFLENDDAAPWKFSDFSLPLRSGSISSGAFSIGTRDYDGLVVVGGDYLKPNESIGTAARSQDGGDHRKAAATPPHGFRSAVAYLPATKSWITVGPNRTDISTDDGRNWRALRPDPALGEPPDADQHWNALSLPFVVGPHGRIGKLRPAALTPAPQRAQP